MNRSDTLAAQAAALDMVMEGINEGRDMRAYVGGMLTAAKRERDYALEGEAYLRRMAALWDDGEVEAALPKHDPIPEAISVRAAYSFGNWPPKTLGERFRDKMAHQHPDRWASEPD